MIDERWAWVALGMVSGVGLTRYHLLLTRFSHPAAVLGNSGEILEEAGLPAEAIQEIRSDLGRQVADQRRRAEAVGARLLVLTDPDYPAHLRRIPQPPPFLYLRGTLEAADEVAIAIVGSRRPTHYGEGITERLAADLAPRGVTIVSGMARGIDTAAHRGALAASGRTIAVLGCGVDVVYPKENGGMMREIIGKGAVVSEFPMGTPPNKDHFPHRNRTISGLSLGTCVVEATDRSGSLITAGWAADQGREVFAVPGNLTSQQSRGTNRLIQDGAKLVTGWQDVVAEIPWPWKERVREPTPKPVAASPPPEGSGEGRILRLLEGEPVPMDQIIRQSGLTPGQVGAVLMNLELQGLVRALPGKRYQRHPLGA